MYTFVMIVFIFAMGAIFGWSIEVIYRHIVDKEKRWFNPGFCVGPWLPIYGVGILTVFLITYLNDASFIRDTIIGKVLLFVVISLCMTIIELIGGIILLKMFNLRLWDYRDERFNYKGFICLKFSFYWMILAAIYYFLIHPAIYDSVVWLSQNIIFSFFVGAFFSIFIADVIYSGNVFNKIKNYATDKGIIVKFEEIKDKIRREQRINDSKAAFFTFMLKENISKLISGDK